MIEVEITVHHAGGTIHIIEQAPVTVQDTEDVVERALAAAVKRAHRRAATSLINPIEVPE